MDVGSGEIFSFFNDRLGTPQMLVDSTNTVIWEGIYKPFGEAEVNPNSSLVNNFRFPGQYYDQETGLHYNYFRHYDPTTGRYITPDPIGLEEDMNLWAYAVNNPINSIDLLGLKGGILMPIRILIKKHLTGWDIVSKVIGKGLRIPTSAAGFFFAIMAPTDAGTANESYLLYQAMNKPQLLPNLPSPLIDISQNYYSEGNFNFCPLELRDN